MVGKEHSRESERNHEWCSLAPSLASFYTFWKLSKFKLLKGDKLVEHGEVRRLAATLKKIFLDDINFSRKNMIGGKLVNANIFTCEHFETAAHCTGQIHPYGKLNRHYLHPSKQSSPKARLRQYQ